MVEKLKSISRQIHWFLLARAAVFALSWFFFPFWLFLAVALYLYLVPLFQAGKLVAPFFALLVLAYVVPNDAIYLAVLALLFYYLLLIKDLLLIDRKSAYELLVLALSFFLFRNFYGQLGGGGLTGASLWYSLFLAALFGVMVVSFTNIFEVNQEAPKNMPYRVAGWLSFLIVWQFLILGLFLSLNATYQSVIIFLISILITDLVPEYAATGKLPREKALATSTAVFALLAVILTLAQWTI